MHEAEGKCKLPKMDNFESPAKIYDGSSVLSIPTNLCKSIKNNQGNCEKA